MSEIDPHAVSGTTLLRLIRNRAAEFGDAPFLLAVRDERRVSYRELEERVAAAHGALDGAALGNGCRVGLLVADPLEFTVAFLAVIARGLWACPLDPSTPPSRHEYLRDRLGALGVSALVGDGPPVSVGVPWLSVPLTSSTPAPVTPEETSGGVILSSSGTTGTPKVVALPTAQLLHTAALIARHNHLTPQDRGFNPLPLFHINAEVVAILASLVAGSSIALDDRFHRTNFWSHVDRLGVTWVNAVPAIVSRLVELHPHEVVPARLRFVRSASAPLPASVLGAFEATIGVPVIESYGMTEAASQICANPLVGTRKAGSVGVPVGVELRVTAVEDEGETSAARTGHVEIRGASIITRYESQGYEDRFDAEGWLRTGDLGYLDDEGYLFLVGRSDDVINRGGEKMFPREIEEVILSVSGVRSVAVIAASDEVFGQVPVSFVELEEVGTDLDALGPRLKEIADVVRESLTRERRPVRVNVVKSMPTLPTGKVHKPSLHRGEVEIIHVELLQ